MYCTCTRYHTRTVFPSIQIIIYRASVLVGTYRYEYRYILVQTMIISGGGERAENSTVLLYSTVLLALPRILYYPVSRTVYAYRTGRNIRIIICCHHVCSVLSTRRRVLVYRYRYEYVLEQGKQLHFLLAVHRTSIAYQLCTSYF